MTDLSFGQMLQHRIDGKPIPKSKAEKEQARLVRKFSGWLKKVDDTPSDRFWWDLDGFKFWTARRYRGSDKMHLSSWVRKSVPLSDIDRVKPLGYVRQKATSAGLVDYYTCEKSTKSDRTQDVINCRE